MNAPDASPTPTPTEPVTVRSAAPAGSRSSFSGALALVLSFAAIAVAGMLWWQYRAFYVSLSQADASTEQALERVRAEQRAQRDAITRVDEQIETLRQLNASVTERLNVLPGRFADLERRLDAVQGGSFDARAALLRSEAEYYLTVANTELGLAHDWESAITALELADGRLAELSDPRLGPVREEIASELLALKSVRLPDVEGLLFSLGRLGQRAAELPMRAEPPTSFATGGDAREAVEPGLGRLVNAVKDTLLGLVRVERRDAPVDHALSAAERALARRSLEIELGAARLAALRADAAAFRTAIDAALARLERDFAPDSAEVEGAAALLREMRGLDVAPEPPDIGGSLAKLRALKAEGR